MRLPVMLHSATRHLRRTLVALSLALLAGSAAGAAPAVPGMFVRVENLSPAPLCVRLDVNIHHVPWFRYRQGHFCRSGLEKGKPPAEAQWLPPGEASPWADVGDLRGDTDESTFSFTVIRAKDAPAGKPARFAVSIATGEDEGALVRRVEAEPAAGSLALLVKRDLSGVRTAEEDAKATLEHVKSLRFPGRRPERIHLAAQVSAAPWYTDMRFPEVTRMHLEVLGRLGLNTTSWPLKDRDLPLRYGMKRVIGHATPPLRTSGCYEDPDLDAMRAQVERLARELRDAGALEDLSYVMLWDEPGTPSLERMRTFPPSNEAFRAYLREQGVSAEAILGADRIRELRAAPTHLVFVEAEAFEGAKPEGDWSVRDKGYLGSAAYSGGKLLWASHFDGLAEVTRQVTVPAAGAYRVWVRRAAIRGHRALFSIEVKQGERAAGAGIFGADDQANGMVWESADLWLEAGEATLRLFKKIGKGPYSQRNVDCVLLTSDPDFVPDETRRGRAPDAGGVAQWQGAPLGDRLDPWRWVRLASSTDGEAAPLLYYHSCEFRRQSLTRLYAGLTRLLREHLGEETAVASNFSPHPFLGYGGHSALSHGPDWLRIAREGGVTLPWSETWLWQIPEAGPQLASYLGDILRADAASAGKWRGFGFYVIGAGGAPLDWMRLETYSILGRGARILNYFAYGPRCFGTCDFYQHEPEKLRLVGELAHEIGGMEELGLADAVPLPGQVALLVSKSTDYRESARKSNVLHHETQWLYLALRHLHHQVEVLTEEDVAAGSLGKRGIRVVYAAASHLLPETAAALAKWVGEGGTLYLETPSFRDHLDQPQPALAELFGAEPGDARYEAKATRAKLELVRERPLDMVQVDAFDVVPLARAPHADAIADAVYLRAPLRLKGARSIGYFAGDRSPALSLHTYGKGRAILCGALLGAAYMRPAVPEMPWDRALVTLVPSQFPDAVRRVLSTPAHLAGVGPAAWASEPLVEVNAMRSPAGLLLLLSDYTRGQEVVEVAVRTPARSPRVRLLHGKVIRQAWENGVLRLRVPIRLTQAVAIDGG